MKTSIIAYVHSEQHYSYSGKDFRGYQDFSSEKLAEKFISENDLTSLLDKKYNDDVLGICLIYLKDLTHNQNRKRFETIFKHGNSINAKKYWDRQSELENIAREKNGFVRCKNNNDITAEDYRGDLNNALTKDTLNYISSGGVFGYLGHSWRKLSHDRIIESVVKKIDVYLDGEKINKWDILSVWLTSSDARHWMDSVEDQNNKIFKQKFIADLPRIFNRGFVYGLDEHDGSLKSTQKLLARYDGRLIVNE